MRYLYILVNLKSPYLDIFDGRDITEMSYWTIFKISNNSFQLVTSICADSSSYGERPCAIIVNRSVIDRIVEKIEGCRLRP